MKSRSSYLAQTHNIRTNTSNVMVNTASPQSLGVKKSILQVLYILTVAIVSTVLLSMSLSVLTWSTFGFRLGHSERTGIMTINGSSVSILSVRDTIFGVARSIRRLLEPTQWISREVTEVRRVRHVLRQLSFLEGRASGTAHGVRRFVFLVGFFGTFATLCAAFMVPYMAPGGYMDTEDDRSFHFGLRGDESDEEDYEDEERALRRAITLDRERILSLTRVVNFWCC